MKVPGKKKALKKVTQESPLDLSPLKLFPWNSRYQTT